MSKPNKPKSNFLQTLLFVVTVFLGYRLIMDRPAADTDKSSYKDLLTHLQTLNRQVKDATIVGGDARPKFEAKLKDALAKKLIDQATFDDLNRHGWILTADTQLKAGLLEAKKGNVGAASAKLQQAQISLVGLNNALKDKPEWTEKSYPVAQLDKPQDLTWTDPQGNKQPWPSAWTGKQLYTAAETALVGRYRTDPVWGFFPGYQFIDFLVNMTGANPAFSYAFAAFLLALLVRLIIYPITQRQLMWGRQMSQLTPLLTDIKAQYKDDPTLQQQKMMELYREYGINPLAGCLPAVVQFPLFMLVYQCMQHYQFEFGKGYFLWMNPATSAASNGFFAPNLGHIDYVMIIIYGISMVVSTMLMPVSDPTQVKQQRMMGVGMSVLFTVFMFFGAVPVAGAFVLYWTFTNILATAQSLRAYKFLPIPPLVKVTTSTGGAYPKTGGNSFWDRLQEEARRKAEAQTQERTNGKPSASNGTSNGQINGQKGSGGTGKPIKHKPKKRK